MATFVLVVRYGTFPLSCQSFFSFSFPLPPSHCQSLSSPEAMMGHKPYRQYKGRTLSGGLQTQKQAAGLAIFHRAISTLGMFLAIGNKRHVGCMSVMPDLDIPEGGS